MTSPLDQYYRMKRRHERLTRLELARLERLKEAGFDMPTIEIIEPARTGEVVFVWVAVIVVAILFAGGIA